MTERTHIDEWFEQLPEDVVSQTQRLLEHIDTMRQTETIYPRKITSSMRSRSLRPPTYAL